MAKSIKSKGLKGYSIAIYGSKASNGVIIITTKRGTGSGGISIDFSATLTNQFTPKKLNLMNA